MDQIYLDNNSTTVIDPLVMDAMAECHRSGFVNPASQHRSGQIARERLETTRESIIELLGGEIKGMGTDELIFTSGGTEANNLVIRGLCGSSPGRVLVSEIEHPSILGAAEHLVRKGFQVERIPVDQHGVVDLNELKAMLTRPARLLSVMLVNNETGVIQPIQEIAGLCRDKNILVHTDAVQAIGKIPINFGALGVDAMTFTAHKLHGPRGIGALMVRSGVQVAPILFGGFQQQAIRPGTEDVALACGLGTAISLGISELEKDSTFIRSLRDRLERRLHEALDHVVVNGKGAERACHTSNVSLIGLNRQAFLMAADMAGLAISTGSACASGSSDPSHVISAMTDNSAIIESSLRISLSRMTTGSEIDSAADKIIRISQDIRAEFRA